MVLLGRMLSNSRVIGSNPTGTIYHPLTKRCHNSPKCLQIVYKQSLLKSQYPDFTSGQLIKSIMRKLLQSKLCDQSRQLTYHHHDHDLCQRQPWYCMYVKFEAPSWWRVFWYALCTLATFIWSTFYHFGGTSDSGPSPYLNAFPVYTLTNSYISINIWCLFYRYNKGNWGTWWLEPWGQKAV